MTWPKRDQAPELNKRHDDMDITFQAQVSFTHCYIETRNWEFTVCSRAETDDIMQDWPTKAVSYRREGRERCLRLPFLDFILVRR